MPHLHIIFYSNKNQVTQRVGALCSPQEYNHFICPKERWDTIFINDKDKIEIVTIVGGG